MGSPVHPAVPVVIFTVQRSGGAVREGLSDLLGPFGKGEGLVVVSYGR